MQYTGSVSSSWVSANRSPNYRGTFYINSADTMAKVYNWASWHFISVNTNNAYQQSRGANDPSSFVVEVYFIDTPRMYNSLSSTTSDCMLESGLVGNDPLNPITCTLDAANHRLYFQNVYAFTSAPLRFYFNSLTVKVDYYYIDVTVYVWANYDAFV